MENDSLPLPHFRGGSNVQHSPPLGQTPSVVAPPTPDISGVIEPDPADLDAILLADALARELPELRLDERFPVPGEDADTCLQDVASARRVAVQARRALAFARNVRGALSRDARRLRLTATTPRVLRGARRSRSSRRARRVARVARRSSAPSSGADGDGDGGPPSGLPSRAPRTVEPRPPDHPRGRPGDGLGQIDRASASTPKKGGPT